MAKTLPNRIIARVREYWTTGSNSLTRQVRIAAARISRSWWTSTHDWSRPDYDFWRRAYHGRARGLELSGLFIKPLVSKVAGWTLGPEPDWKLDSEPAAEALADWWADHHPEVLAAWRASLKQGDSFVVVNSDLTLTILAPETVDPIVADDDFSSVVGWRVTQTYRRPDSSGDRMTVVDEYTAQTRVRRTEMPSGPPIVETFPNLLGRLPIVHIPNQPQDGETFGHPEAEALVEIFHRYGQVFEAAIEGNVQQGRATPVLSFSTKDDLDRFWELYGTTEKNTLPDGTTESQTVVSVDLTQLLTVSGATFEWKSPQPFTQETERLLGLMFYLILEHTELPEFVFGNAIASSKASTETQMPVFIRFIEGRRAEMVGWLTELAEVALGYLALVTPGVALATPALQWDALDQQDGKLTLETVSWAYSEGLLDAKTALLLSPLDVEDIDAVLAAAKAEREAAFPEAAEPPEEDALALFRKEVERQEAAEDDD